MSLLLFDSGRACLHRLDLVSLFFFFSITKRHFVTLSRTKFVFSWGVIDIIYFGCPDQVFWSQSDSKPFDFEYLILLWHIKKKKKTQ